MIQWTDFSSRVIPLVGAIINISFDIYSKVTGEIFGGYGSTEVVAVHRSGCGMEHREL